MVAAKKKDIGIVKINKNVQQHLKKLEEYLLFSGYLFKEGSVICHKSGTQKFLP